MPKASDSDSIVVLKKLGVLFVTFYTIYYLVAIILVPSCGADWDRLGRLPFEHSKTRFRPDQDGEPLAAWLAMLLTYALTFLVFYFFIKSTAKSWDYAATLSLGHLVLCCIATTSFPQWWVWWLTIILLTMALSIASELSNYFLRDLKEIIVE